MPNEKKPHRTRVELVSDPDWLVAVSKAAKEAGFGSMSAYIRVAVNEKMKREGLNPPDNPVRSRGQPRKKKE